MPCRFPGPHPRGSLRGLAGGGVSRPTPGGRGSPCCRRGQRGHRLRTMYRVKTLSIASSIYEDRVLFKYQLLQ